MHAQSESVSVTALRLMALAMCCAAAMSRTRSASSSGGASMGGGGNRGEFSSPPAERRPLMSPSGLRISGCEAGSWLVSVASERLARLERDVMQLN